MKKFIGMMVATSAWVWAGSAQAIMSTTPMQGKPGTVVQGKLEHAGAGKLVIDGVTYQFSHTTGKVLDQQGRPTGTLPPVGTSVSGRIAGGATAGRIDELRIAP